MMNLLKRQRLAFALCTCNQHIRIVKGKTKLRTVSFSEILAAPRIWLPSQVNIEF